MSATSPAPRVGVDAPAKINLYLHVTGRRPDGYHELDSLVVFAGIGDRIEAEAADGLILDVRGPFSGALSGTGDNLVLEAARGLAALAGREAAARIVLHKHLPVAAGIGGGSADAAATLRALESLWAVSIPREQMDALALSLGADVPVCYASSPCVMSGIGERLRPMADLPEVALVLVNPHVGLATRTVFAARQGSFSAPATLDGPPRDASALASLLAQCRNDLAPAAESVLPVIGDMLAALSDLPDCLLARLSGSGPTCFGLFADEAEASRAARRIAAGHPEWWVRACRILADPPKVET